MGNAIAEGVKTATVELSKGIKESSDTMGDAIAQGAQEFVTNAAKVNDALQTSSDAMVENNQKSHTLYADLAEEINSNVRGLSVQMQEEAKKITEEYSKAGKQLLEELNVSKTGFHSSLETMREQLNTTLESMVSRQSDEASKIFNGLSNQIENSLSSTGDAVDKKVQMIDQALEHEIEKVMKEMGGALASISQQFTKDYTELVNAMNKVVNKG
jgi:DNA anti-recombination protein RmuC